MKTRLVIISPMNEVDDFIGSLSFTIFRLKMFKTDIISLVAAMATIVISMPIPVASKIHAIAKRHAGIYSAKLKKLTVRSKV